MKRIDVFQLYQETGGFYAGIRSLLASVGHDYKYRLLYGPFARPPILWIEFQPGGKKCNPGELALPVSGICDFACKDWTLARRMRRMFPIKLLRDSVAVNAIFVRSPRVKTYKRKLSRTIRKGDFRFLQTAS